MDDDQNVRDTLQDLLDCAGLASITFASASEYLEFPRPDVPACLVLDVQLPDIDGLALQRQIAEERPAIVFITAHGDVCSSVQAMKAGAVDFLTKPFRSDALLDAIFLALQRDSQDRRKRAELKELRQRLAFLTQRERELLPLVAGGLLNKQSAAQLGISVITVQAHRSRMMRKMKVTSVAELVRVAGELQIPVPHSRRSQRRRSDEPDALTG